MALTLKTVRSWKTLKDTINFLLGTTGAGGTLTARSLIGRAGATDGATAAITAGTDGHVMRRSGTSIGFGTIVAGGIASDAVTTAKILDANVTTGKLATAAVTGAKVDAGALKMFTITGADATGAPAQATCTGAKVGDTVVGVSNLTDLSSASAVCETTITVADKLVVNSTNLSAKKLLVFLIQRS